MNCTSIHITGPRGKEREESQKYTGSTEGSSQDEPKQLTPRHDIIKMV